MQFTVQFSFASVSAHVKTCRQRVSGLLAVSSDELPCRSSFCRMLL